MKSKRILNHIAVIVALVSGLVASADLQGQPQRRGMPDSTQISVMVDTLAARLSLADSTKDKVSEIYFESFNEMQKTMERNRGDFMAMRDARQKITSKRDQKINALLSEDQKKLYQKMLEEEQKRRQERMRQRRGQF